MQSTSIMKVVSSIIQDDCVGVSATYVFLLLLMHFKIAHRPAYMWSYIRRPRSQGRPRQDHWLFIEVPILTTKYSDDKFARKCADASVIRNKTGKYYVTDMHWNMIAIMIRSIMTIHKVDFHPGLSIETRGA